MVGSNIRCKMMMTKDWCQLLDQILEARWWWPAIPYANVFLLFGCLTSFTRITSCLVQWHKILHRVWQGGTSIKDKGSQLEGWWWCQPSQSFQTPFPATYRSPVSKEEYIPFICAGSSTLSWMVTGHSFELALMKYLISVDVWTSACTLLVWLHLYYKCFLEIEYTIESDQTRKVQAPEHSHWQSTKTH